MLSSDSLDNLMQPILDRQEQISIYIIRKIAKRIKEIGEVIPSDVNALERLLKTGDDVRLINNELARLTGLQVHDIQRMIEVIAEDAYLDARPFYDYSKQPYIPFKKNEPLQQVIKAIAKQTVDTYVNLSNSRATGFITYNRARPGMFQFKTIDQAYKDIVDEAIQASQSGIVAYNESLRKSLLQLADSGLRRLSWDSGYTQRLDTALRRNLLDGIRAINQGVQDEVGKQFNSDGKEITVHANSAPDHEPIQGHQFTNEEFEKLQNGENFEDVNKEKFIGIERAIGVWNCRHFTYSIIVGFSKPMFTKEQLEEYKRKNAEGYTLPNGKHLTMYECTQRMRQMETDIRYAKETQIMFKESGNMQEAKHKQAKLNALMDRYKEFCKACGLKARWDKTFVPHYKKISISD